MNRGDERAPLRAYAKIDTAWQRLKEFTGESFRSELTEYATCCSFVEDEFARYGSIDFYGMSIGYLYELTHFHFMPHKDPFFETVVRFARAHDLTNIADVGCGIGLDAQALTREGFQVALYDIPSPSLRYAGWRFETEMELPGMTRSIDTLGVEHHELVYAVDVLEHIPDPFTEIPRLFQAADFVAVNLFQHDSDSWDGRDMHYPLNHWQLLPAFNQHADLMEVEVAGDTVVTLWRTSKGSHQ